ncbi:hypothetical protein, partial [Segatella buccae]|uniref:hypothetical protein n=1 Tax=Segatella buccae TaxID=28126 RepID=UPI001955481B
AFKCGSFASSESPNEKNGGLSRRFKAYFPYYLASFYGSDSVKVIYRHPVSCSSVFYLILMASEQNISP